MGDLGVALKGHIWLGEPHIPVHTHLRLGGLRSTKSEASADHRGPGVMKVQPRCAAGDGGRRSEHYAGLLSCPLSGLTSIL